METQFDTGPLLRPAQLAEARSELKSLQEKLSSPHIEDKGEVAKQLRRVSKSVADQTPIPPQSGEEEGRMVSRSKELLSGILQGMPSQEEMRKAPPGAVDKHMKWEKANKLKIQEWKNLQLRLTNGEEPEAANLERHRPTGSSLNMDNAHIPGKQFFMPETTSPSVVFSEAQIVFLRNLNPALADMLGMMSNDQRSEVKDAIEGIGLSAASVAGKKGVEIREKKKLSPEHLAKLKAGREAAKKAA